jgi:phosphoglycolate phosphatase
MFDFDGTLVDSEKAIYQCFQSITTQLAPERMEYAKNILIGPPLRDTASEILGQKYHNQLEQFIELFIQMHDEQVVQHTKPYPNVIQVLKQLHSKNISMALVTNKRFEPTKKLIDYFKWNNFFETIECSDSKVKIRNKNQMIQDVIKQNLTFKGSYFVGDTVNDGLSANLNHLRFIKASYGYGKQQNWTDVITYKEIHEFGEILDLIYR